MASQGDGGTRKLAAIMFTDIRGFSWKMATDEIAAMQILKTHDAMMKDVIDQSGGRVIKSIGDSFMVDFASAVNAVSCAIQLQRNFWEYNKGKSEFEKIEVRMGIHLGDVIDMGSDMFGDGVNIASRVEAITEPNRICITQDIYSQVKKKMHLNVFNIGSMKFKNIDEPVGVYEILIDDIPGLSVPSETAKQAPSRKAAEKISEQEAKEAKSVEAAKLKVEKQVEDKIKVHYKKAEIYFQKGMYNEAEKELAEIDKLTSPPTPAKQEVKVDKEEEDRQKAVQAHYKKAEEFFQKGQLDDAAKAIEEIYRLVPIHYGAQMIMAQIEEERFKQAEERRRRIEAERRAMQERQDKVETLLERARLHLKREEFDDGLIAVQELYTIEPDHAEGKAIEQEVARIKEEREEQARLLAEEQARKLAEALEKRAEQARVILEQPVEEKEKASKKLPLQVGVGIVALVVLYFIGTVIKSTFFPTRASIVVLAASQPNPDSPDAQLSNGLATLLAEDLASYQHVSVVSPTSAMASVNTARAELVRSLGVDAVMVVNARKGSPEFSLDVELVNAKEETLWKETLNATNALSLTGLRESIVAQVLDALGIGEDVQPFASLTGSNNACEQYIQGTVLVEDGREPRVRLGVEFLKLAVQTDDRFAQAHARLAKGLLTLYKLGGESDRALVREAAGYAEAALRHSENDPLVLQVAGEVLRYQQQFADARSSLERGLERQPASAYALRVLAQLDLIEGNAGRAQEIAQRALSLDPRNPESHLVAGLVSHMRQEYGRALASYDAALERGANDSLVTIRYKVNAWMTAEMDKQPAIDFYRNQLERFPLDYRYYYWLARTYERVGKRFEGPGQEAYQRGIAIAESLLTVNPNDATASSYLGLLLVRYRTDQRSKVLADRAIQLEPQTSSHYYRKANIHAILGEQEAALEALREAVKREYSFTEILNPDFDAMKKEPEFTAIVQVKPTQ